MKISITPMARTFLAERNTPAITVASLLFSSCCAGPLPPEVKPGAPTDPDGFVPHAVDQLIVYVDSLLAPRPEMVIDLRSFPRYQELFIRGWD